MATREKTIDLVARLFTK